MTVLFVFGAGASCSSDVVKFNPPLGNKLYDELVKFDLQYWGNLNSCLTPIFRRDFELGTLLIPIFHPEMVVDLHKAMARFFFKYTPSPGNLYCQLIQRIKNSNRDSDIRFSTLNYERLLELAMRINNVDYDIIYPHGCCHLLSMNALIYANQVVLNDFNSNMIRGINVEAVHDSKYFENYLDELSVPPVMSLFEPQKRNIMLGGDYIDCQRQNFKQQCKEANVIIVIGIQYRKHDKHVWDALGETNGTIIYCSGKTAIKNFKKWADNHNKKINYEVLEGYFRDEFDKICNFAKI